MLPRAEVVHVTEHAAASYPLVKLRVIQFQTQFRSGVNAFTGIGISTKSRSCRCQLVQPIGSFW